MVNEFGEVTLFEKAKQSLVATPAMVIDLALVRENLLKLSAYLKPHGITVRPHTKTHKSKRLAQEQLNTGSVGLTVAKVGEAEVMAEVCDDILIGYPAIDAHRCSRIAKLAHKITLRVAVDSKYGIEALARAAKEAGSTIGVLIDLNCGSDRTGVATPELSLELAQHVVCCGEGVRLDGLFFYPGQVWVPVDQQPPVLKKIDDLLKKTLNLWTEAGLKAEIVSGGSTPTAYQSHHITSQTEIRPGTHIFNDMNTVHAGFCTLQDCSVALICTVISDAVDGKVIIDAGSKSLTSDKNVTQPDSGYGYILEYPEAQVSKLSEEHGELDVRNCKSVPEVGDRVTLIPNHICPCLNLQEQVWLQTENGLEELTVDTQGMII
ncbi:MAG: alanine racemase [Planctomycetaceae bacterium]|nr:alanine racemase [Planctomycetaceae bacterium]